MDSYQEHTVTSSPSTSTGIEEDEEVPSLSLYDNVTQTKGDDIEESTNLDYGEVEVKISQFTVLMCRSFSMLTIGIFLCLASFPFTRLIPFNRFN
ncbi:unnamed protein product [Trichobilharzia regenti]|nr:unnamed protein product [Trichobilharzia regenti]